jgi:hypothetical protein
MVILILTFYPVLGVDYIDFDSIAGVPNYHPNRTLRYTF